MKPRILVIEDNPQNMYLTRFLLEKRGCEVLPAEDGPTGIALASKERPDVILLDIQLPGMDGYAIAAALRSDADLDSVPIVAVTSYAMAGDRERILAAGADAYIEKPINPDTFTAQVLALVPASRGGTGPERRDGERPEGERP